LKLRHGVLGVTLIAAALAAWRLQPSAQDPVVDLGRDRSSVVRRADSNVATGSTQVTTVLPVKPRDRIDNEAATLFAEPAWAQAPPPPTAVAVLAPPTPTVAAAPPLPFRLLGRYSDGVTPAVFLQFNDQNLVVKVGDIVTDLYKVESLDDNNLTLLHLPTQQRQTLSLGAAK
jgi:hypothetical protein